MSEVFEIRVGRHLARGRNIVLQWIRRHCWGLKSNLAVQQPGPVIVNPYDLREVEERAIRRFCRELSSLGIQGRNKLIEKQLL
jgi:hypothetical protein